MVNIEVLPIPADYPRRGTHHIGAGRICLCQNGTSHRFGSRVDPNFTVIWDIGEGPHPMMRVKVLFLVTLVYSMAFTEVWEVRPLRNKEFIGLRNWGTDLSSHAQFRWAKVTPRQQSSSVSQES